MEEGIEKCERRRKLETRDVTKTERQTNITPYREYVYVDRRARK